VAADIMSALRVLLVDDQDLVRAGFRLILQAHDGVEVVGEAGDGDEAVAVAAEVRPDVVLMDIRMPGLDGIAATSAIAALPDAPRVLILTTFALNSYVYDALRAGASGFLLKDAPPEELLAAIRVVARGDSLLGVSITRQVIQEFVTQRAPAAPREDVRERVSELTQRESEILELVAEGMSNAEIADLLVVAPSTVKTHVAQVLMKLGLRDRVQAVVFAYEAGLVVPRDAR
jgi:DNA-binding NarL/FixJ family response regulator